MRIELTPQTCRRPNPLNEVKSVVRKLPVLEKLGYLVLPTRGLKVLNCDPTARYSDIPLHRQRIGPKDFNAVVSGTFRQLHPNECVLYPAGPVMRKGTLDTEGPASSRGRGAIAVLKDGTIVAGRCIGNSKKDIQERFAEPSNPVREFMGGGALLVEDGKRIRDVDLEVFHRRVEVLLDNGGKAMDFVNKQDVTRLEFRQRANQVRRSDQCWPRGYG